MGSTPVKHSVLNVKAVVAAFNQEKALVGAVITILRMELFQALVLTLLTTLDLATQLMGNFIIAQFLSVIVTMQCPGRGLGLVPPSPLLEYWAGGHCTVHQ